MARSTAEKVKAATRVRDVADAMFVLSLNDRFKSRDLYTTISALRSAAVHHCLVVLREEELPWGVVMVAAVSDEELVRFHEGRLDVLNFRGWVAGKNPIVVDVVSLNEKKDKELQQISEAVLKKFTQNRKLMTP